MEQTANPIGFDFRLDDVLGISAESRRTWEQADEVARACPPVSLICGEVGVGKHTIARVIHATSGRGEQSFVRLSCLGETGQGLDASELERELDQVDFREGILFITDVGFLGSAAQSALVKKILSNVRVAANGNGESSNVSLILSVRLERGKDLADTISNEIVALVGTSVVDVPPLRERFADLDDLLPRFLLQAADDLGVRAPRVESELLDVFRRYSWPGNTSELRGVISRAILVGGGGSLGRTSVPSSWLVEPNQADGNAVGANGSSPNGDDVHHHEGLAGGIRLTEAGIHLEHLERDLVIQALDMTRGNKTRAGRLLGLNRDQIRYRVEKFGLDPSAGKR